MTAATRSSRSIRIGPAAAIPIGEGRSYRIGSLTVAVYRTRAGDVFATQAACPHRGGPLADGVVGDGKVVCPLHGYTFRLTNGEPVGQECAALRTFPASIDAAGNVVVTVDVDTA